MQVGAVTEALEVQAEAAALQTDSSTVGALVTNRAVEDLPVNGRNAIRLVQLAPGAAESVQSSLGRGNRPDDRRQPSVVSANGQTDSANNFMLDGLGCEFSPDVIFEMDSVAVDSAGGVDVSDTNR